MTITANTHVESTPKALREFVDVFSSVHVAGDVAKVLSCVEVDALAGLLRAEGHNEAADSWISEQVKTDDEGDAHYVAEEGSES